MGEPVARGGSSHLQGDLDPMTTARRRQIGRGVVGGVLLLASAGCSGVAYPPTYTETELRTMCERRGGWWRGDLIPGYCEFQGAWLIESP
jgi:hypothetical protein